MCAAANFSHRYEINYEKPGIVLIFNNKFNDKVPDSKNPEVEVYKYPKMVREGSEKDVERIEALFKDKLKYRVEKFENKTESEIKNEIHKYEQIDYKDDSIFVCFIMSHGTFNGKDTIIETHDFKTVHLERDFVKPFKKINSLKNKPKVFFIQACRGNNTLEKHTQLSTNASSTSTSLLPRSDHDPYQEAIIIPNQEEFNDKNTDSIEASNEAHLFRVFSVVTGFKSIRPDEGSWFIQELCNLIETQTKIDLLEIIKTLNRNMLQKRTESGMQQIGETIIENLTTNVYFFPYKS